LHEAMSPKEAMHHLKVVAMLLQKKGEEAERV
jgi:hypothetical protein